MKAKTTVKREFDRVDFEKQGEYWIFKFKNGDEDIALTSGVIPAVVINAGCSLSISVSGIINFDVEDFKN